MLEEKCRTFLISGMAPDSAHDLSHTERVVYNARLILERENADEYVTIAAAWLHDCVVLPKNDPDRHMASRMAAEKAVQFLKKTGFDQNRLDKAAHAIEAHSFSAQTKPKTTEAKIVRDADRLDAMGAVGIARCFSVGGKLNRLLYSPIDPFCQSREPDDAVFTIDHFYSKLFRLADGMTTEIGKREARRRIEFMELFIQQLREEIH